MTIAVPEPFASALSAGRASAVGDAEAPTAEALFGRALARLEAGRESEARADLETARDALGDACVLELAFLDLRQGGSPEEAARCAREVAARVPAGTALEARSRHLLGLAEGKLRNAAPALDALLRAQEVYGALGDRLGRARVQDTLGALHASEGRVDLALTQYALSLVTKTLAGDRYGMAITLGNLGRAHLALGRFREALECFEQNRQIATGLGDLRGVARMLEDCGRARVGLEDTDGARRDFEACIEITAREGYRDLELFARKDLGSLLTRRGLLDRADEELAHAETLLSKGEPAYPRLLVDAARAELLLERRDPTALEKLEDAARRFGELRVPDAELSILRTLARAYAERKLGRMAEACLERALERARSEGYERFLRPLREDLVALALPGELSEETGRLADGEAPGSAPPAAGSAEGAPGGYVLLETVGRGAFGEVFRAFDPLRNQIVALKKVRLEAVYDPELREQRKRSVLTELRAASRIRHPGVARVFAVGEDADGGQYVVQEFVHGPSLREVLQSHPPMPLEQVFQTLGQVASALETLHREDVVHRDLKPENILLRNPHGTPVLVDFGVAFVPRSPESFDASWTVGTVGYIAPELRRGQAVSVRSDMYSLGAVFFEWLSGSLPAPGDLPGDIAGALHPELSTEVRELVGALLAADPASRPPAAEVARRCHRLADEESAPGMLTAGAVPDLTDSWDLHRFLSTDEVVRRGAEHDAGAPDADRGPGR